MMMTLLNLLSQELYAPIKLKVSLLLYFKNMQKNAHVVTIDGYENVPTNDEKSLQKAVANQPVTVAIEATGKAFQLYQSVGLISHYNLLYLISCC